MVCDIDYIVYSIMEGGKIIIPEDAFLEHFDDLLRTEYPLVLLWGGRDNGRSREVAQLVVIKMLRDKYFRFILIKKTAESVKDSQWKDIKKVCEDWGISHYFDFRIAPLEITCNLNGNTCLARGCDNPEKLKSISNPSGAWYEEANQLTESDYITASTTLRNPSGEVQEFLTFNPEVPDGTDFDEFWLYRNYLSVHYKKGEMSFTDYIESKMPDGTIHKKKYISIHGTYRNNTYCTDDRRAKLEGLKATNVHYYNMYTEGLWDNRMSGGEALKNFDATVHVGKYPYMPGIALHIYFDENVVPYFPCGIYQIKEDTLYQIDEITAMHPNNTVAWICREIRRKCLSWGHDAGMFIGGDATSQKDDVKQEKGHDLFKLILDGLSDFRPVRRTFAKNPSVVMSLNYFNNILCGERKVKFFMNTDCRVTRRDYELTKEAPDGTLDKKKSIDAKTGQQYQAHGHFVDIGRYVLCTTFHSDYINFQRGGSPGKMTIGKNISRNSY